MFERSPLQQASKRAAELLAERSKIQAAIEKARTALPAAEQRLQAAVEELGTAEADAALSDAGQSPTVTRSQRRLVTEAREALESMEASIAGLTRRLNALPILEAAQQYREARDQAFETELKNFRGEYMAAAVRFASLVNRGRAMAASFGLQLAGLERIALFEPENLNPIAELTANIGEIPWARDAKAITTFETLTAAMSPGIQIDRLAQDLERAAADLQRQRDIDRMNASQGHPHTIEHSEQVVNERDEYLRQIAANRQVGVDRV